MCVSHPGPLVLQTHQRLLCGHTLTRLVQAHPAEGPPAVIMEEVLTRSLVWEEGAGAPHGDLQRAIVRNTQVPRGIRCTWRHSWWQTTSAEGSQARWTGSPPDFIPDAALPLAVTGGGARVHDLRDWLDLRLERAKGRAVVNMAGTGSHSPVRAEYWVLKMDHHICFSQRSQPAHLGCPLPSEHDLWLPE